MNLKLGYQQIAQFVGSNAA